MTNDSSISDKMFDLAFDGYSTKELAKLAKIPLGDAILLQSNSKNVKSSSYNAMKKTIFKLKLQKTSNKMFTLGLNGYSTQDLAQKANISKNDAVLIQSKSTIVSENSLIAMEKLTDQLIIKE